MIRTAEVIRERGSMPEVKAGIRDLRVLKTTQSSFVDFVDDEYRALPYDDDRLLSTVVTADWSYSSPLGGAQQYDDAFNNVRDTILEVFAGPADTGIFSASVQNSQHLTQTKILETIPTVKSVTLAYPNVHYFGFDFARFSEIPGLTGEGSGSGKVFNPVDKPSGLIKSTLSRQSSTQSSRNEQTAWSAVPLPLTKHSKVTLTYPKNFILETLRTYSCQLKYFTGACSTCCCRGCSTSSARARLSCHGQIGEKEAVKHNLDNELFIVSTATESRNLFKSLTFSTSL